MHNILKKTILQTIPFLLTTLMFSTTAISQDINHVLLIGIDGFSSKSVEYANIPTIKSLMDQGSFTLTKRSVLPSASAPNWASMFMGVPTEIHGYTQWGSQSPEIPLDYEMKNNIFPTIFQILREQKPEFNQGLVYEWEGMKYLADTLSINYHEQALDYLDNKRILADLSIKHIQESKPNFMSIIFESPDHMGHTYGFESTEYYVELNHVDSEIKRILDYIMTLEEYDDVLIIIASDHGGINTGHGGITLAELETPFIISGKGIKKNYEIEGLMMQYDVAPTIADLFGIEIPEIWRGKSVYEQIYDEFSESFVKDIYDTPSEIRQTIFIDLNGYKYNQEPEKGLIIKHNIYHNSKSSYEKYLKR